MAKKVILSGHVQGVFCRHYCSQYARKYRIRGSASNLSNGTVKLILETNDNEIIKEYLSALRTNPMGVRFFGHISNIEIVDYDGPLSGDYNF